MPSIEGRFYREVRCPNCHKLLGYEYVFAGRLLFNCSRCSEMVVLNFKHIKTKENVTAIAEEFTMGVSSTK